MLFLHLAANLFRGHFGREDLRRLGYTFELGVIAASHLDDDHRLVHRGRLPTLQYLIGHITAAEAVGPPRVTGSPREVPP